MSDESVIVALGLLGALYLVGPYLHLLAKERKILKETITTLGKKGDESSALMAKYLEQRSQTQLLQLIIALGIEIVLLMTLVRLHMDIAVLVAAIPATCFLVVSLFIWLFPAFSWQQLKQ